MAGRRLLLVLTAKNEAPGLLEWVAYHRVIGFTDIVVYQISFRLRRTRLVEELEARVEGRFTRSMKIDY